MTDQFNDETYPGITKLRAAWEAASPRARDLFFEELQHSSLGDVPGGPLFREPNTDVGPVGDDGLDF
jgi:hypothetical protein